MDFYCSLPVDVSEKETASAPQAKTLDRIDSGKAANIKKCVLHINKLANR